MKRIGLLLVALSFSAVALALAPEIEADRLLLQAKTALDANDYAQATASLAKAEKLGTKLPDTFYYHYGYALFKMDDIEKGRRMLERYLNETGTKGKFYREALETLNAVEKRSLEIEKIKQQKEAESRKASERQAQIDANWHTLPMAYPGYSARNRVKVHKVDGGYFYDDAPSFSMEEMADKICPQLKSRFMNEEGPWASFTNCRCDHTESGNNWDVTCYADTRSNWFLKKERQEKR
ncbi:hypothetical protein [Noviherbaspirillum autotrophicum]|nr:hypothetical protein [Noviherbaspirillum autotrophicum]